MGNNGGETMKTKIKTKTVLTHGEDVNAMIAALRKTGDFDIDRSEDNAVKVRHTATGTCVLKAIQEDKGDPLQWTVKHLANLFEAPKDPVKASTILDTPEQIDSYRLCALKGALKLEMAGMKRRGRSAYSMLKSEYGFKGNRAKVLAQTQALVDKTLG
jgi:hypothetical protein